MAGFVKPVGFLPPASGSARQNGERPIVKISANLLATFNGINKAYYAGKRARDQQRFGASWESSKQKRSHASSCGFTFGESDSKRLLPTALEKLIFTFADLPDLDALFFVSHPFSARIRQYLSALKAAYFIKPTRFGLELVANNCVSLVHLNEHVLAKQCFDSVSRRLFVRLIRRNAQTLRSITIEHNHKGDSALYTHWLEPATFCPLLERLDLPSENPSPQFHERLTPINLPNLRFIGRVCWPDADIITFLNRGFNLRVIQLLSVRSVDCARALAAASLRGLEVLSFKLDCAIRTVSAEQLTAMCAALGEAFEKMPSLTSLTVIPLDGKAPQRTIEPDGAVWRFSALTELAVGGVNGAPRVIARTLKRLSIGNLTFASMDHIVDHIQCAAVVVLDLANIHVTGPSTKTWPSLKHMRLVFTAPNCIPPALSFCPNLQQLIVSPLPERVAMRLVEAAERKQLSHLCSRGIVRFSDCSATFDTVQRLVRLFPSLTQISLTATTRAQYGVKLQEWADRLADTVRPKRLTVAGVPAAQAARPRRKSG